ncbi:MAG TPA: NAD(P)-binding domain-containing protein [Mycobacteriales bacterium]|nr:NAD(P)-binding domain-containing protein [Mycobacteriales bacterium]
MRIGILGSGVVGRTLATGWAPYGHETRIGTRDEMQPELDGFDTGSLADVAAWAELVVVAVVGASAETLARDLALALAGKVVIDATNPLDFSSGGPQLFVGTDDSLGERVQRAAPDARVVKAYNTVGNLLMVDPQLDGGPPTMPIAGDDEDAKATVLDLLEQTGWDPIDIGGISASRWLEPMALVWTAYGIRSGTWTHAFRLLRG